MNAMGMHESNRHFHHHHNPPSANNNNNNNAMPSSSSSSPRKRDELDGGSMHSTASSSNTNTNTNTSTTTTTTNNNNNSSSSSKGGSPHHRQAGEQLRKTGSNRELRKTGSNRDLDRSSGHNPLSARKKQQAVASPSKQVQLKSKLMSGGGAGGSGSTSPTTNGNSKNKKSSSKPKRSTAWQGLQDAINGIKPHVDLCSTEAVRAMRHLEKALDHLEKQLAAQEQVALPPPPKQRLNVKYTLYVNEVTPEPSPAKDVTLCRATYQANNPSEDRSTVVVGQDFIFAGVWDGHGGTSAAEFTQEHLFGNFQQAYEQREGRGASTISQAFMHAFSQTDRDYFDYARKVNKPQVFFAGTCAVACFVNLQTGVVTCANLGDSRAVLGVYQNGKAKTIPLSVDHSADNLIEQTRLRNEHPDDKDVVVDMDDSGADPDWRVKKLAAFTRSIGDLHLKEKNTSALFNSYVPPDQRILPRPGLTCKRTGVKKPKYISTEPEIKEATVQDGFVIIACDGVWDEMSSEEAVNIVAWLLSKHDPEKVNIAELFIEETLKRAVHRISATYEEEEDLTLQELKARPPGKDSDRHRSMLHDDITVVILQLGKREDLQKRFGGTLFSMLQNNNKSKHKSRHACDSVEDEFFDSNMFESQSIMSMSRTKAKREMAVRNSILDWTSTIQMLQADAQRAATDKQIIEMMNAFDDMDAKSLKILFNAVDIDGNGTLDREEITRLVHHVIQMDVSPAVIDLAFSEMDADGSGDVDIDEFIQFFGH